MDPSPDTETQQYLEGLLKLIGGDGKQLEELAATKSQSACRRVLKDEVGFYCKDCALHYYRFYYSSILKLFKYIISVLCQDCFRAGNHVGHYCINYSLL